MAALTIGAIPMFMFRRHTGEMSAYRADPYLSYKTGNAPPFRAARVDARRWRYPRPCERCAPRPITRCTGQDVFGSWRRTGTYPRDLRRGHAPRC